MPDYRQVDGVAGGSATSLTLPWPQATLSGSLLLAAVAVAGGSDVDIVMPAGWTLIDGEVDRLVNTTIAIYKKENAAVNSGNVTANFVLAGTSTPSARYAELYLVEYTNMATSNAIDRSLPTAAASSQTAALTGTSTTTQASETAFALAAHGNPASSLGANTSGYTEIMQKGSATNGADRMNSAIYEKTLTTLTTFDISIPLVGGISRPWCVKAITLKKQSAPPPPSGWDDGKIHLCDALQEWGNIPSSTVATAWAASQDVVSGQSGHFGGFADDLVTAKPAIILMPYTKSVQYQGGLSFPESWYAHSGIPATSANRVHPSGFPSVFIMQPDSTAAWTDTTGSIGPVGAVYHGYTEFQVQNIKDIIQTANNLYTTDPFAGAWLDSAGTFSLKGQVVPGSPAPGSPYTAGTWLPLVNALVQAVVDGNPGKTIYANGVDSNPTLATIVKGVMSENWLRSAGAGALPGAAPTDASWRTDVQTALDTQVTNSCVEEAYVKLWNAALTGAQRTAWGNFVCASFLLAQRGKLCLSFAIDQTTDPWNRTYPACFAVNLDTPRDTFSTIIAYRHKTGTAGGWVYRRRFNKGVSYLNTDANPVVVTLDRSDYLELDGSAAPVTYTVPGKTGVILKTTAGAIAAPTNTAAPGVPTGTQTVGSTLTAVTGTWTGSPTFSYVWQRDVAGNAVYTNIPGATSTTYGLMPADAGNKVRVIVTGTNAGGSLPANSTATGLINAGAAIPGNTALPVVTPTAPAAGQTVTTTNGSWTNSPSSFTYIWQTVDPNTLAATNIGGATAQTYDITDAETGFLLRCKVTAVNASGSSTANSDPTDVVAPRPPAVPTNTVLPAAPTGTTTVGSTLTAQTGTWTGSPSFTYQWQRVTTLTEDIAGETAGTYTLATADLGALIQVVVTGSNAGGVGDVVTSAATDVVTAAPTPPPPPPPPGPAAPEYTYLLCGRDGKPLAPPLTGVLGRRIALQHLAPTIATLTVPSTTEALQGVVESYTRLKIYRDDVLRFHGRIWDIEDDLSGDTERTLLTAYDPLFPFGLTPYVPALTLEEAIGSLDNPRRYANKTMFFIMADLLAKFSGAAEDATGSSHPGELLVGGSVGAAPRVDRTIKPSALMGEWARERLVDVDNGIEWVCRPVEGTVARYNTNGVISDTLQHWEFIEQVGALDLFYPTTGGQSLVTLAYGTGPANLSKVNQSSPGSERVNWGLANGGGSGRKPKARQKIDADSVNRFGVLFKAEDFGNTADPAVLSQRAKFLLQLEPPRALSVTPVPGAVRLYDDFQVGDLVNVAISRGRVQRFEMQRIYGATLVISDNDGTESVEDLVIGDP